MANLFVPNYGKEPVHAQAFGNAWCESYEADMAASQNDKIYFGIIPAGVEVFMTVRKNEACGTSVTFDLGFEPTEGSPAADLDYFIDGANVAAAGEGVHACIPLKFELPVKLVGTVLGANLTGTPLINLTLVGNMVGVK